MKILAFDTSLNKTYIALDTGRATVSKIYETDENNYHSAYLIIGIKNILEENGVSLSDIDLFAVNHGPGSFTGIRAGVTVAKTLAKELDKKVIGINSSDILYETYQNLDPDVVLDARRGQFYLRKNSPLPGRAEIELIPYDNISDCITRKTVICDTSSVLSLKEYLKGREIKFINFEEDNVDLSKALINIAKNAVGSENLKWNSLNAAYIQAPPIHKK